MTVWVYAIQDGEFVEVAEVQNGDVVDGDPDPIENAFPEGIPEDETEVARMFNAVPMVSSTDFEVEWDQPVPEGIEQRSLSSDEFRQFETWVQSVHSDFVTAEETDKTLTQFSDSQVPQAAKDRIREAIWSGALFSDIESIPSSARMELQQFLLDELEDGGWSLDSMASKLSDEFDVSEDRAELIARSETQSITNTAYEEAIEDQGLEDELYYWTGRIDDRTTEACIWLLETTNPQHGGNPVPLPELKELIQEAPEHDDDLADGIAREWAAHPACRKRFVRYVE